MSTPNEPGLLDGIRVIDLATERSEMTGRTLADLGAEVIKIEPAGGCTARSWPPFAKDGTEPASLYWASVGLGKKSIVLDIATEADREKLLKLIDSADVLVESFDPGYMASLGLGYDDLKDRNSALVYVSVTPYGQDGPEAHSPASELVLEAASGRSTCQGDPDRPPAPLGYPQTYFHGGVQAAADACLALFERERSGLGQYLDVSIQAAMVWTLLHATGYPALFPGQDAPSAGQNRGAPMLPVYRGVARVKAESSDGYIVTSFGLGAIGARSIQYCMEWAKREGKLSERFHHIDWNGWQAMVADGTLSMEDATAAGEEMWSFLKTKPKRDLMDRACSDILFLSPIYTIDEVVEDPHLAAKGFWVEIDGRNHPGAALALSRAPMTPRAPAPALDADRALLDEVMAPPRIEASAPGAARGGVLDGVKVADFSWLGVGPINAKALADHGATVLRIESESRPGMLRFLGPFKDNQPGLNNSQFFANFNSSKLGMALNLGTEEGKRIAQKLVDWADIVVESFRPGAMERLGLDYATISKKRPDIIMFSTCIRGQTGPEKFFPGTGAQGAALCGMESITGWPDRPPAGVHGAYTDVIVPRYGVATLAAALLNRKRTGLGVHIDASQVEPGIRFLEPLMLDYTVNGHVAGPQGQASMYACPRGVYPAQGTERYVALEVLTAEQWRALRSVAPLDAFDDPALDSLDARIDCREALDAAVAAWIAPLQAEDVAAKLKAAGVPATVAHWPSELFDEPQLSHRGFFVELNHTAMGPVKYDGLATRYSATPGRLRKAAPCLGEDTHYVVTELLGLGEDEIAEAAAAGALQ